MALIEAKAENLPPDHGLEQAKFYCKRLNVLFVFASNGYQFVEYDVFTGQTSRPNPLAESKNRFFFKILLYGNERTG